jgi:methylated-DNA-[protein]-cysteine S-methyltransferase
MSSFLCYNLRIAIQKEMKMFYTIHKTILCDILLVGDDSGLQHLEFMIPTNITGAKIESEWVESKSFFIKEIKQIDEFCNKQRKVFDLKLNPQGTDFQKKVWVELYKIPFGETRSYKDIAKAIGNEKASRAVGGANNKNPIPLIIPCHRVIGSSGKPAGFACGIDMQLKLLEFERL